AGSFLAEGCSLTGGVIDLYGGADVRPVLRVRLDKVYTDYERKGFFRIGLLPIGVLEGVTFQVEHPDSVTNSLGQMYRWLGGKSARRLELRRVTFLVLGAVTNRLEAGRGRVVAEGKLDLLDGVSFVSGTTQMRAGRARLQITGQQAGQIILEASPPWTNNLFSR